MTRAIITKETSKILTAMERETHRDPRPKSENIRRGYRHDLTKYQ